METQPVLSQLVLSEEKNGLHVEVLGQLNHTDAERDLRLSTPESNK